MKRCDVMKNFKSLIKKYIYKIIGNVKKRKFKYTDFSIISNNCFGGIVYRNNHLPYNSPTVGLFFMAEDYIKFIYNLNYYLNQDLIEVNINNSKHLKYLKKIKYNSPIGKLGDIEIMFMHYSTFEEAKEKWNRRKHRINYNRLIFKFSEQNECKYEHLKKFKEFEAKNKICFTHKKYPKFNTIHFKEFELNPLKFNDSKEKIFKKYFNIYEYINKIR